MCVKIRTEATTKIFLSLFTIVKVLEIFISLNISNILFNKYSNTKNMKEFLIQAWTTQSEISAEKLKKQWQIFIVLLRDEKKTTILNQNSRLQRIQRRKKKNKS